ncbi:MAG: LuxR C-terminal-related transcriptional regulator [Caldilineaceae bacterium]
MPTPILATKLYVPPSRPSLVHRARLIERLNAGLHGKVTLVSAPAGFGKTTLVSEWIEELRVAAEKAGAIANRKSAIVNSIAWLSLDARDSDPVRFLAYLVAALQTVAVQVGATALTMLQSPQPPPAETVLTSLLNEVSGLQQNFLLVLDDYHLIESKTVGQALAFLIDHLPVQMHLVIATREDPPITLARLRARGQLNEVRAADLRFTPDEAGEFLNRGMGLVLTAQEITALEKRTEGWIAGLQLAALSMQGSKEGGNPDIASFLQSFTGSHRFVMDYLVEEVLHQQPATVQDFLLRTSILERMCGPLCDAVIGDSVLSQSPIVNSQSQTFLEYLEQANLFIIPLDSERRWYRYHHLFAELLQQRLHQGIHTMESSVNELHVRASQWYEENGLEIEAFHHAAAANDIERAERLIEGKGIPLHLRGAVIAILNWLESLPTSVLNARPSLWWRFASLLLVNGQTTGVEEKLSAAEAALPSGEPNGKTRLLIGRIAAARAVLALTRYQVETMISQSLRALEYLPASNLFQRANATWTLGYAYLFAGERVAARQTLTEAISLSQAARDTFTTILATLGLGIVQESENQLYLAAETYRRVLELAGEQPLQIIYEAHLGIARVSYEWNNLETAEQYGRQSLHLAKQYDRVIDRFIICEVFLARLKLAQGDVTGASEILTQADQVARQQNFSSRIPEVAAAQVLLYLRQGNLTAAAHLAQTYKLPIGQARVHLAQGDPSAALAVLLPYQQQMEAKGWADERLKAKILQMLALQAKGDKKQALQLLGEVLAVAEPSGFVRLFLDEGLPMAQLLSAAADQGIMPNYVRKLLAGFAIEAPDHLKKIVVSSFVTPPQTLIEPLSQRELEVLQLLAAGLSNQEISTRLFLALSTVKGHNQRIFDKLQVQRRTEAIARARELGLI